jgi:hypothetical protein
MKRVIGKKDEETYKHTAMRCLALAELLRWAPRLDEYSAAAVEQFVVDLLGDEEIWCRGCEYEYEYCVNNICFQCTANKKGGCYQVCLQLEILAPHICGVIQPVWKELACADFEAASITLTRVGAKILQFLRESGGGECRQET